MAWFGIAALCFLAGGYLLRLDQLRRPIGESEVTTASYWVVSSDQDGPTAFMWRCDACNAMGFAPTESDTVQAMNDHVANTHPDTGYEAPPIPE
jgi:hypothetical protein